MNLIIINLYKAFFIRNKPNFRVNLNSSNAYIDDESLYEDNNYDDYIELPQPKTSRNIILSNRNMSNGFFYFKLH